MCVEEKNGRHFPAYYDLRHNNKVAGCFVNETKNKSILMTTKDKGMV